MISMIVAIAENRAIGKDNKLLWNLPADLQYFKRMTMGKPILMGRKTYESIGRPLPGRVNVVLSSDTNYSPEGVTVVHSIADALSVAAEFEEIVIIGGASFYQQMLPLTERLYITQVHQAFEADTFFPEINDLEWDKLTEEPHQADDKNAIDYTFESYQRIS